MGINNSGDAATIEDCLRFLLGVDWPKKDNILNWPPDVFAVTGALLQKSGAYIKVIEAWPPRNYHEWDNFIAGIAKDWKAASVKQKWKCPPKILQWWKIIRKHSSLPIRRISDTPEVWHALIYLTCAADVACDQIGVACEEVWNDRFLWRGICQLLACVGDGEPSTLCEAIHSSKFVVLPKVHTPQKGITIRSITHNLALSESADLSINWLLTTVFQNDEDASGTDHSAVLLIIPDPIELTPSQFKASKPPEALLREMDRDEFGFFEYAPAASADIVRRFDILYEQTKRDVGRVDGVVLPEMALTPVEYEKLKKHVIKNYPAVSFLCSGVYSAPTKRGAGLNYAAIWRRLNGRDFVKAQQHKHHRWYLDEAQICQYGMGSVLDPRKKWWENISIKQRELNFLCIRAWLTACVLICEDLARPDPVGNTIRSVGPNLVIALLQDGPQLSHRWSARCATALTDDPGCSVLTVTSLGMAALSRPQTDSIGHVAPSRVIAHWKDRETGSRQISLPENKKAVVLCLTRKNEKEWTADGRQSRRAALVKLAGVHYV